ncbi:hypothetical protein RhiirA5_354030 [Rhizophagus irregularis]|uniref:Uncharacterized protein n=2 Tax=Rhizophagus irregularis TaxID=588596 RepID=A0A2I1ED64_9GLOM|nr:hypothetical protein RhiirA5_354030 [Rhizophagus irregularis]PKC73220.1 hypothetical protein RhiirA1_410836 [Rhizophagus irregularis]PKK78902.1 hypothetical protein RhiirC2_728545 [Rhizophagus irregularis]PKY20060.1 hypothetical protein RhiirB3_407757 [Rhizophagus irregularis]GBC48443.1 hypothetical protein RIR_e67374_A0A2I1ED64_9GLOM [Rhizophagus irregularis DAOM 181602=DAOM 197198]
MFLLGSKYNFVLVFLMMVLVLTSPTYSIPQGDPDTPPTPPPPGGPTPPGNSTDVPPTATP